MNPYLVIMAGGSGTRFWPKSTARKPKQLLAFGRSESGAGETLLTQTLARFDGIVPADRRIVVTTRALESSVREQCPGVLVLGEPQGRNTAPCVYWAAREIAERGGDAVMMVMPADHYIARADRFRDTLKQAIERATLNDELVTLGVKPDRPETGYGYLRTEGSGTPMKVDAFVEKPDIDRAREFLAAGNYLWNGGMFVWRTSVILRAFDEHMPELGKAWDSAGGDVTKAYPRMTATSIDFGVMEKASGVVTFPLDCGWDDLGSWTSLESLADVLRARHEAGVLSAGELIAIESRGNIVDAPGRLVALLGVEDLIVVEAGESLLVARKDRAQDIKKIVDQVRQARPDLV